MRKSASDQQSQPLVSVVIVSYNTVSLLRSCLRSVEREILGESGAEAIAAEVIVIDNASTDGSAAMVKSEFPTAHLIENRNNAGFSRANNQAIEVARGEYGLFLNPDAELTPGSLSGLIAAISSRPDYGVVGPRLVYGDGASQPSRRRFPTLATGFVESTPVGWRLGGLWPFSKVISDYLCSDLPLDLPGDADWLVGACLLVRKATFDRVGGFDERFFMYSEELDWCKRIVEAGWKILYWPNALVVHHESKSASANLSRRSILFNESKCRYYEKHFGPTWGIALRAWLWKLSVFEMLDETVKLSLGHKPELRRKRLRIWRDIVFTQLRSLGEAIKRLAPSGSSGSIRTRQK